MQNLLSQSLTDIRRKGSFDDRQPWFFTAESVPEPPPRTTDESLILPLWMVTIQGIKQIPLRDEDRDKLNMMDPAAADALMELVSTLDVFDLEVDSKYLSRLAGMRNIISLSAITERNKYGSTDFSTSIGASTATSSHVFYEHLNGATTSLHNKKNDDINGNTNSNGNDKHTGSPNKKFKHGTSVPHLAKRSSLFSLSYRTRESDSSRELGSPSMGMTGVTASSSATSARNNSYVPLVSKLVSANEKLADCNLHVMLVRDEKEVIGAHALTYHLVVENTSRLSEIMAWNDREDDVLDDEDEEEADSVENTVHKMNMENEKLRMDMNTKQNDKALSDSGASENESSGDKDSLHSDSHQSKQQPNAKAKATNELSEIRVVSPNTTGISVTIDNGAGMNDLSVSEMKLRRRKSKMNEKKRKNWSLLQSAAEPGSHGLSLVRRRSIVTGRAVALQASAQGITNLEAANGLKGKDESGVSFSDRLFTRTTSYAVTASNVTSSRSLLGVGARSGNLPYRSQSPNLDQSSSSSDEVLRIRTHWGIFSPKDESERKDIDLESLHSSEVYHDAVEEEPKKLCSIRMVTSFFIVFLVFTSLIVILVMQELNQLSPV